MDRTVGPYPRATPCIYTHLILDLKPLAHAFYSFWEGFNLHQEAFTAYEQGKASGRYYRMIFE